ncbi:hypothetical protein [Yersinia pestis]|uniref:hypothetical protein n=2 Tax=Yersinia pestis TaxID=632 RepID=UPI00084A0A1E
MTTQNRFRDNEIRAPQGTQLTAKSWLTEAALRMLMNNLDPDVAENPKELVVYGGVCGVFPVFPVFRHFLRCGSGLFL